MKKLSYAIFWLLIFLVACHEKLNIEPKESVSTEVALSTDQGVKTALVGAYDLLARSALWSGGIIVKTELYANSGDLIWTFFGGNEINAKNISLSNRSVEQFWLQAYAAINQTNNILSALSVLEHEDRLKVEAEARFIRGALYFDLVNLFAKTWVDGDPSVNPGVPLISEPSTDLKVNALVARSSVADVYSFLTEDLRFAKENLPENKGVFANTYAASALLSRVFLMQEKFSEAATEAGEVIDFGSFQLLLDPSLVFNQPENSGEDIFAVQFSLQSGGYGGTQLNNVSIHFSGIDEGGNGAIVIADDHLAKYEEEDHRAELFYFDSRQGLRRSSKWLAQRGNNVSIIRLAEMYLTRAECRFRMGDAIGAAEDINLIRERAGLPSLSQDDLTLDKILHERYLELAFEGHIFRDVKRNRKNFGDIPFNDNRMIYPIPQREMDLNPNLVQNPEY